MNVKENETEERLRGCIVGFTSDERGFKDPLPTMLNRMMVGHDDTPKSTRAEQAHQFEEAVWIAVLAIYTRHEFADTYLIHARSLYKKLTDKKPPYWEELGDLVTRKLRPIYPAFWQRRQVIRYLHKD